MKSLGIVRKIDDLGRIVIPIELRRTLDLLEGDAVEFFTENDSIIIRKYAPGCVFCKNVSDLNTYEDKYICKNCLEEIRSK